MVSKELLEQWKLAIQRAGGQEVFEAQVLPTCSDAVKLAYEIYKRSMGGRAKWL